MVTQSLERSQQKLWLAAIKLPMYSVAVIPICLGTAIAWWQTEVISGFTFARFLLGAICIVAWSNISNDVFDSDTGIDKNKHHSLVNLTQNRPLIFWIGNAFLLLGILSILSIAWSQQDFTVLGLILGCCFLGYVYQGPPFRLGYQGLGEVLCFFAYGPLALSAVYYSQTQAWSVTTLMASVLLGLVTSLILFCSHFHQVEDDIAAGKRSPIVRLGTARGAKLLPWGCGIFFGLVVIYVGTGFFPIWSLLIFGSAPYAIKLCQFVGQHHDQPTVVNNCKFIAVALHFWSGFLLSAGFIASLFLDPRVMG